MYLYELNTTKVIDLLGNFRSTIFLVSFVSGFVILPCNTSSIPAVESCCHTRNILRNLALLQFPRKSNQQPCERRHGISPRISEGNRQSPCAERADRELRSRGNHGASQVSD